MPAGAGQLASASREFANGKPTWVLVRSSKLKNGKDMDKVFLEVQAKLRSRVKLVKLNWEDESAQAARDEFSLGSAPASVVADSKGKVVEKFEGPKSAREMIDKLSSLLSDKIKPHAAK